MVAEPVAHAPPRGLYRRRRDADHRPLRARFPGLDRHVLYDLGDFLDDYAVNPKLRNDLGLRFLVDLAGSRLEAIPLKLEFAHTRLADGDDATRRL